MDYAFLSLVMFFSALLTTSIGFGFALLAVPILMILLPVKLAITVNMALALLTNLINLPRVWRYLDNQFTLKLFSGTFFGMLMGTLIYIYLDLYLLKIMVCSIVLLLTLTMIRGYTLPLPKQVAPYIVGLMSGTLGSSVSLPGPPAILYLTSTNTHKNQFVAVTTSLFCYVYATSLLLFLISGSLPDNFTTVALPLIPALLLGIATGNYIRNHINQLVFKYLTYTILIFSSVYTLITSI